MAVVGLLQSAATATAYVESVGEVSHDQQIGRGPKGYLRADN